MMRMTFELLPLGIIWYIMHFYSDSTLETKSEKSIGKPWCLPKWLNSSFLSLWCEKKSKYYNEFSLWCNHSTLNWEKVFSMKRYLDFFNMFKIELSNLYSNSQMNRPKSPAICKEICKWWNILLQYFKYLPSICIWLDQDFLQKRNIMHDFWWILN